MTLKANNFTSADLNVPVFKDSDLKTIIVNYVGNLIEPENGEVTMEMIVDVFATQFPDFLLPIAEENFFRGYDVGLADKRAISNGPSTTDTDDDDDSTP